MGDKDMPGNFFNEGNKPLISIIIPVFQTRNYLGRCLNSVLNSTIREIEVILIDDGSTDGSSELCDDFANRDNRIRVIHQQNSGVSVARNRGLDIAGGDWIWFVDSDDAIVKGSLEHFYSIVSNHSVDTICGGLVEITEPGICREVKMPNYIDVPKEQFLCDLKMYCNVMMLFSNNIIRRYGIRFTKGIKMAEDLEFQYKYLLHCSSLISTDKIVYEVYFRRGSATRNDRTNERTAQDTIQVIKNLCEYIKKSGETGGEWFDARLRLLYKAGLNSMMLLNRDLRRSFIKEYRKLKNFLLENGFANVVDSTITYSLIFPSIYSIILRRRIRKNNGR